MGLTTSNAGAVVQGSTPTIEKTTHTVRMLKGTFVQSVGRDVKADDVVEISDKDYRFLKPYAFCEDAEDEAVVDVVEDEAPVETTDEIDADELEADITEAVTEAVERVESKRKKAQ